MTPTPEQTAAGCIAAFEHLFCAAPSVDKITRLGGGITSTITFLTTVPPGGLSEDRITQLSDAMHTATTQITAFFKTSLTPMPAAPVAPPSAAPAAAPSLPVETAPMAGAGGGGATAAAADEVKETPPKSKLETVIAHLNEGYAWAIEGGLPWTSSDLIKLVSLDSDFYKSIDRRGLFSPCMYRLNDIYSIFFERSHTNSLTPLQKEGLHIFRGRPDKAWNRVFKENSTSPLGTPNLTWEMIQEAAKEALKYESQAR